MDEPPGQYEPQIPGINCPAKEQKQICNPWYAAIFSGIVPGWGQWYTGRTWAGIAFHGGMYLLIIAFFSVLLLLSLYRLMIPGVQFIFLAMFAGVWVYGMCDAWQAAQRINQGSLAFSGKSWLFWIPAVEVAISIGYLVLIITLVTGVLVMGMIAPGSISSHSIHDMNVSVSASQPDANHIVVTVQNVPDPDEIFEMYSKVTDDNGNTQTKTIGLDYSDVEKGRTMAFTGPYAGSNHVTTTVLFDCNHTPIQILDVNI